MENDPNRERELPDTLPGISPSQIDSSADNERGEMFREIFEHSLIGIYRTTPEGRILLANPALVKMLGYDSAGELYDRDLDRSGYEPSYSRKEFKRRIEAEGRVEGLEYAWLRRDGSTLYVRESARAVRDESGRILYYEGTVEDISDRKKLKERLAESERQLRLLVENSEDIIALFSPNGKFIYFHGPVKYGFTSTDLYGKDPTAILGDTQGQEKISQVREVAESGRIVRQESHVIIGNHEIWTHDEAYPVRNREGVVIAVGCICRNITERKQIEEQIRRERERMGLILASQNTAACLFDREYNIIWANEKLCDITGTNNPVGKKSYALFDDGEMDGPNIGAKEAFATGEIVFSSIKQVQNGRWYETVSIPIKDDRGDVFNVIEGITDITERRRAEIELKSSEDRFRSLFMNAPLGYQSLDYSGFIRDINTKWLELMGYSRDEVVGRHIAEFFDPKHDKQFVQKFSEFIKAGEIRGIEYEMIRKDGRRLWISIDGNIQYDTDGNFMRTHCILQDITERKRAEEALRKSEANWRSLVNDAPLEIIIIDLEGKILFTNKRTREKNGIDGIPGAIFQIFPTEYHESLWEILEKVLDSGRSRRMEVSTVEHDDRMKLTEYTIGAIHEEGTFISFMMIGKDVTEEREAVEGLRVSEDRLRRLIESSGDKIIIQDVDGTVRYYHGPDRLGIKAEEIVGKKPEEFLPGYLCETIASHLQQVVDSKCPVHIEEKWEYKGVEAWFDVEAFPINNDAGEIVSVGKICRNITEYKLAMERTRISEERFRAVFESAGDAIFIKNRDFRYTMINPAMERLFGLDKNFIVGRQDSEFFDNTEAEHIAEVERKVMKGRIIAEEHSLDLNGAVRTLQIVRVPMKDNTNNIESICGIARDITDKRSAEERLRQSEHRYRTLVDNLKIGVTLINRDMEMISFNRTMAEMFPKLRESDSRRCYEIYHDPPAAKICDYCSTVKTFRDGKTHEHQAKMKIGDRVRTIRTISNPVYDDTGEVIAVIEMIDDVTDRLRMEEELAKTEKLESIGILAGGIAHDFNNIMTAIMGNLSLALIDLDKNSKVFKLVSAAEDATARAKGLTQQLLTFAKGGSPIRKVVSPGNLIRESTRLALAGSNVKYEISLPSDLYRCEIDAGQIGQVLHNLVINADQAMPNGGMVRISAQNVMINAGEIEALREGRYVVISIEDNGIGIPDQHLKKIFDPFFTTKQKGSGLGLATCYSIVVNHNGKLTVSSEIGKGTRFDLYLPATIKREKESETLIDFPNDSRERRGRILIVDDEPGIRKIARITLEKLGYRVAETDNSDDAERIYRTAQSSEDPFSALLIDLTLPGGPGGDKLIGDILKIDPEARAVVSSGYSTDPVMSDFRRYGFRGRVSKPYRAGELGRVIDQVLAKEPGDET